MRRSKLSENREINETWRQVNILRTREQVPPGRASIIDNRTNITTIKLLIKLDLFKNT